MNRFFLASSWLFVSSANAFVVQPPKQLFTSALPATLSVNLEKIEHLTDEDHVGKSDPYVRFALEQDNWVFDKDLGEMKSSTKQGELSPEYDETFDFDIPDDMGLENVVLSVAVMDDDPLKDDDLGGCEIDLEDLGLGEDPMAVDRVVDNNWFSKDARIYLNLSYKP